MTRVQFGKIAKTAMNTGAVKMPDGSKLVYHGGEFARDRYFAVYDVNGNCVDTAFSPLNLYYLFR